jgi:hypothetical protein
MSTGMHYSDKYSDNDESTVLCSESTVSTHSKIGKREGISTYFVFCVAISRQIVSSIVVIGSLSLIPRLLQEREQ